MLSYFKVKDNAYAPFFGSSDAACFDLAASLQNEKVKVYAYGKEEPIEVHVQHGSISINPFSRALIPTNLILGIPNGFSVRIHPRSGQALKKGIVLANMEGVIDADYVDPLYIMLLNISGNIVQISDGERIAQGELVKSVEYTLSEISEAPERYGDRLGGLGSTGVMQPKK